MDKIIKSTLTNIAGFYDQRQVGNMGPLGFRRSTNLKNLLNCLNRLIEEQVIIPNISTFLDLGCADGRVNIFFSYLMKTSIGIELDEWTLDEYQPLKAKLGIQLKKAGLMAPPKNIHLFQGDAIREKIYNTIGNQTGCFFEDIDIFYTYLMLNAEIAELIVKKAKKGAIFMIYGLDRIMPHYDGLHLLKGLSPLEGILAVYRK